MNHMSFLDAFLIFFIPGPIKFMADEFWSRLPVIGLGVRGGGNLTIEKKDSLNIKAYERAKELLLSGYPIVVFPEGTRSRDGRLGVFKRSFAKLARETSATVIPIIIDTWDCLRPETIRVNHLRFRVRVLDPVGPEEWENRTVSEAVAFFHDRIETALHGLFNERMKEPGYYRRDPSFATRRPIRSRRGGRKTDSIYS